MRSRSGKANRLGWGLGEKPASGREAGRGGRGRNAETEARSDFDRPPRQGSPRRRDSLRLLTAHLLGPTPGRHFAH